MKPQKRYALWIGILFIIFNIIICYFVLNSPEVKYTQDNSDLIALIFPNILITVLVNSAIDRVIPINGLFSSGILFYGFGSVYCFLIGAFLGWLFGKIKLKLNLGTQY